MNALDLFDAFVDDIVDTSSGSSPLHRSGHYVTGALLDWKGRSGDVLTWRRRDVDEFLLVYWPEQGPAVEEIVDDAVACAAGFLAWGFSRGHLSGDPVEELIGLARRRGDAVRDLAMDRSLWGPSKILVTQIQAEGVEPSDNDAVQRGSQISTHARSRSAIASSDLRGALGSGMTPARPPASATPSLAATGA